MEGTKQLTPAEKEQVYEEIRQGSVPAGHRLVLSYEHFFKGMAQEKMRKYKVDQTHFEDVFDLFRLTALSEVPKFDGNKSSFPYFMKFPLELAISEYVSKTCRPLSTTTKITQEQNRINARVSQLESQGQIITQDLILEKCKVTRSLVEKFLRTGLMIESGSSLNAPVSEDGDSWQDWLVDDSPSVFELLLKTEMVAIVQTVVDSLNPREAEVIRRRYLGDELFTFEMLSQFIGVSKQRVSQIEVVALGKIKDRLIDKYQVQTMDDVIMA